MKTKPWSQVALALTCILLLLPAPALASTSEPLEIVADLWMYPDGSARGTFTATSDLFSDSGEASETFFIADDTTHGVKTLVGEHGTIKIKFQAQLTWFSEFTGEANGRFVIVSGTGAYQKLHGVGKSFATIDLSTGHIYARYTAAAHFD